MNIPNNQCQYPGSEHLLKDTEMSGGSVIYQDIDLQPWTNGLFMWRVMSNSIFTDDIVGFEDTLENAKESAIKALIGETYQLKLPIAITYRRKD